MSEEAAAAPAPAGGGGSKVPLLLALVNTLAVLAALGTLYYTKVMYKRPPITEEAERKRLEAAHKQKTVTEATAPGMVDFGPVTVNIEPYPAPPPAVEGEPDNAPAAIAGKLHYVTMAFSVEIVDAGQKPAIEEVRPVIMDSLLSMLAHKPFHELSTVQGRYVLRTQILELVNRLTLNLPSHPPVLASSLAKPAAKGGHGEGGGEHEGGEHGAPPAAEGHGEGGGEHGGGEHGGGEGHGAKKAEAPEGPPMKELYPDGLASGVYFNQFIVQ
jgi:flagellar basal body-associated protein FliL